MVDYLPMTSLHRESRFVLTVLLEKYRGPLGTSAFLLYQFYLVRKVKHAVNVTVAGR